jgi:hypothetical protein
MTTQPINIVDKIVLDIVHYIDDVSREQKNTGILQFKQTQDRLREIITKHLSTQSNVVEIKKIY